MVQSSNDLTKTLVPDNNENADESQTEVTLEQDKDGNSYLHLVLPATAVNFLNGHDPNSLFDAGNLAETG